MYLSRLVIKNYRSIESLDIQLAKGKNVIVGRNNSGKSNIMKALDLVLGESAPTYKKYENVMESDFYTWKSVENGESQINTTKNIFIYCELTREQGEELNWAEIDKCYGYYKYNSSIPSNAIDHDFADAFAINQDELERFDKVYVNSKLTNQVRFNTELINSQSLAFVFKADRNEKHEVSKDIRFFYRNSIRDAWTMAFSAPIRNEFLQSAVIPSFRDPQNQLRLNTWTWYGKLVKHLTKDHTHETDLQKAFDGVRLVADKIFQTAKENIQRSSMSVAFPGAELSFQFNNDIRSEIYKNCSIYVDDGVKSQLTDKGSGIQSAVIIGLYSYYVREVNSVSSALLCIEEPELYLHPHARRVISDRLDDFLNANKNQVILTTHSADFIRTTDNSLNIILVRKNNGGSYATRVNVKSQKSLLLDNNHNEIFFADKVIVCEGFDDYLLKWVAKEKFKESLDANNISIVSVGGKDNIRKFVDLLLLMKIDCYVFADFDYFLRDSNIEADKYKEQQGNKIKSYRHESIESLPKGFFEQKCIFSDQSSAMIDSIKALRADLKKKYESLFYKAKSTEDFPKEKEAVVALLRKLRNRGVGILDGELENLSKDSVLLSPENKFDREKIFQISHLLQHEGKNISDIINTSLVEEFFESILGKGNGSSVAVAEIQEVVCDTFKSAK